MSKRDDFVQAMIDIANDDSHGYSQYWRWGPDYDCSSMTYEAAYRAGYDISRDDPRYTGTIIEDFTRAGFRCDEFDGNLGDLEPGDILLNTQHHVAVYIGNGQLAEASSDEYGGIEGYNSGDQTGWEIHICPVYDYGPWTHILTPPAEGGNPTPVPHDGVLHGIDVSGYDGAPFDDHTAWAYEGADFVIVKVTEGTYFVNDCWEWQYNKAKNDGRLLGVYHYASNGDAIEQADYFYEYVSHLIGECLPFLDWEQKNNAGNWGDTNWCRRFVDRFHERSGIYPGIYVQGSSVWQCENCSDVSPLWIAAWLGDDPDHWDVYPSDMHYNTGAWDNWTVWQYSSSGEQTDRNVANIDAATWKKLCGNEEDIVTPQDKKDIAWEVLWGHWEVNGDPNWTLGGAIINMVKDVWGYDLAGVRSGDRVVGTDIAANNVNNHLPDIIDAIANPADADAIAKKVQAAVEESVEKIELNVHVKE